MVRKRLSYVLFSGASKKNVRNVSWATGNRSSGKTLFPLSLFFFKKKCGQKECEQARFPLIRGGLLSRVSTSAPVKAVKPFQLTRQTLKNNKQTLKQVMVPGGESDIILCQSHNHANIFVRHIAVCGAEGPPGCVRVQSPRIEMMVPGGETLQERCAPKRRHVTSSTCFPPLPMPLSDGDNSLNKKTVWSQTGEAEVVLRSP